MLEARNGKRGAIGPIWLTGYLFFDIALDPRPCREARGLPERPEDRHRPRYRPPSPRILEGSGQGPCPLDPDRRARPLLLPGC